MRFCAIAILALLPLAISAQDKGNVPLGAKPKLSRAGQECRNYIEQLAIKKKEAIVAANSEGLDEIRFKLNACVIDHGDELAKRNVVTAATVIGWLSDDSLTKWMNYYSDLKAKYDALIEVKTAAAAANLLTISAIPVGFFTYIYLHGDRLFCAMDAPMGLECKKTGPYGYVYDSSITAMIAEEKSGTRYLIGCLPTPDCARLVPGEYPFRWAGSDAIAIPELITESEKNGNSHTGVYSILSRNP